MSEPTDEHRGGGDPWIGQVFASRYRIDKPLGRGATGAVYRASHVKFGRAFAVKILAAELAVDPKVVRRFGREAELGGKVRHPNVISVVDVGELPDGTRFMVMELAIGTDLASILEQDAPLPGPRAVHLLRGLCEGLTHAHERHVIHRDLKPENVIVERDDHGVEVPRVVDFGIAIARDEADDLEAPGRLTTTGLVLGTPHYMAPEQATGSAMDHRIDLFALGVIAYEMLTGVMPFDGAGAEVARANLLEPTPPMAERAPSVVVDPLLEAFTQRLMAKEPDARPPTAKATRELLELIERDRAAAAAMLGVPLVDAVEQLAMPAIARTRSGRRLETVPEPLLAGRRGPTPVPPSWTEPTVPTTTTQQQQPTTATTVDAPGPRRDLDPYARAATRREGLDADVVAQAAAADGRARARMGLAAGAVVLLAALVIWLATRGPTPAPAAVISPDAAVIVVIANKLDAGVAEMPEGAVDAALGVPADAAAPRSAPADAAPMLRADAAVRVVVRAPADAGVRRVAVDAAPEAVADGAPLSAADLARLYGAVGRELKEHAAAHPDDDLTDQWARFRRIRLAQALATDDSRRTTTAELLAMRKSLGAKR